MTKIVRGARFLLKRSNIGGVIPELPNTPSGQDDDHTQPYWDENNIYVGELFLNTADNKLWVRTDGGIEQIPVFEGDDLRIPKGDLIFGEASGIIRYNAEEKDFIGKFTSDDPNEPEEWVSLTKGPFFRIVSESTIFLINDDGSILPESREIELRINTNLEAGEVEWSIPYGDYTGMITPSTGITSISGESITIRFDDMESNIIRVRAELGSLYFDQVVIAKLKEGIGLSVILNKDTFAFHDDGDGIDLNEGICDLTVFKNFNLLEFKETGLPEVGKYTVDVVETGIVGDVEFFGLNIKQFRYRPTGFQGSNDANLELTVKTIDPISDEEISIVRNVSYAIVTDGFIFDITTNSNFFILDDDTGIYEPDTAIFGLNTNLIGSVLWELEEGMLIGSTVTFPVTKPNVTETIEVPINLLLSDRLKLRATLSNPTITRTDAESITKVYDGIGLVAQSSNSNITFYRDLEGNIDNISQNWSDLEVMKNLQRLSYIPGTTQQLNRYTVEVDQSHGVTGTISTITRNINGDMVDDFVFTPTSVADNINSAYVDLTIRTLIPDSSTNINNPGRVSTIVKRITYTIVTDGIFFDIISDSFVLLADDQGVYNPDEVHLFLNTNLGDEVIWTVEEGNYDGIFSGNTLEEDELEVTIRETGMFSDFLKVKAVSKNDSNFFDFVFINKVYDGIGLVANPSNANHTYHADEIGEPINIAGGNCKLFVFKNLKMLPFNSGTTPIKNEYIIEVIEDGIEGTIGTFQTFFEGNPILGFEYRPTGFVGNSIEATVDLIVKTISPQDRGGFSSTPIEYPVRLSYNLVTDGTDGIFYDIISTSQIFQLDEDGNPIPEDIVLSISTNLGVGTDWVLLSGFYDNLSGGTLDWDEFYETGNTLTIDYNLMYSDVIRIQADSINNTEFFDIISIFKIYDGVGLIVIGSNENHTFHEDAENPGQVTGPGGWDAGICDLTVFKNVNKLVYNDTIDQENPNEGEYTVIIKSLIGISGNTSKFNDDFRFTPSNFIDNETSGTVELEIRTKLRGRGTSGSIFKAPKILSYNLVRDGIDGSRSFAILDMFKRFPKSQLNDPSNEVPSGLTYDFNNDELLPLTNYNGWTREIPPVDTGTTDAIQAFHKNVDPLWIIKGLARTTATSPISDIIEWNPPRISSGLFEAVILRPIITINGPISWTKNGNYEILTGFNNWQLTPSPNNTTVHIEFHSFGEVLISADYNVKIVIVDPTDPNIEDNTLINGIGVFKLDGSLDSNFELDGNITDGSKINIRQFGINTSSLTVEFTYQIDDYVTTKEISFTNVSDAELFFPEFDGDKLVIKRGGTSGDKITESSDLKGNPGREIQIDVDGSGNIRQQYVGDTTWDVIGTRDDLTGVPNLPGEIGTLSTNISTETITRGVQVTNLNSSISTETSIRIFQRKQREFEIMTTTSNLLKSVGRTTLEINEPNTLGVNVELNVGGTIISPTDNNWVFIGNGRYLKNQRFDILIYYVNSSGDPVNQFYIIGDEEDIVDIDTTYFTINRVTGIRNFDDVDISTIDSDNRVMGLRINLTVIETESNPGGGGISSSYHNETVTVIMAT